MHNSPVLSKLDFKRELGFYFRFATATIFQDRALSGACQKSFQIWQDVVLAPLDAKLNDIVTTARSPSDKSFQIVIDFTETLDFAEAKPSDTLIAGKLSALKALLRDFQTRCSDGELKPLQEIKDLFLLLGQRVKELYQSYCAHLSFQLQMPNLFLEWSYVPKNDRTGILDSTDLAGSCRVFDRPGENLVSIVKLGIREKGFSWDSACQLPYILIHELVCHAFQSITPAEEKRLVAEQNCGWSEGWMDVLAFWMTQDLAGRSKCANFPAWLGGCEASVSKAASVLHERRARNPMQLADDEMNQRRSLRNAPGRLITVYGGERASKTLGKRRTLRLSLVLNSISMPEETRSDIADSIAILLETVRLDAQEELISICEAFALSGDWQDFKIKLDRLVGY